MNKPTESMEQWNFEYKALREIVKIMGKHDATDADILSVIQKFRQEAVEEGCIQAYKLFLEEIRNAKAKFPSKNEFELVVDVRDVEKSIKHLVDLQSLKK